MLGRIRRPSINSLELLEMERPPPKLIKDDPLSIYETTLMKLKEGSQRCQSLPSTDAISTDVSCITATDSSETIRSDCSSGDSSLNSSGNQSTSMCFSTEKRNKTLSVLYLFSKYKSTKNVPTSLEEDAMVIENDCSSVNTSASVDNS